MDLTIIERCDQTWFKKKISGIKILCYFYFYSFEDALLEGKDAFKDVLYLLEFENLLYFIIFSKNSFLLSNHLLFIFRFFFLYLFQALFFVTLITIA